MHVLLGILGFAFILIILLDAFETIVLPRRVTGRFRLTRIFYRYTWLVWRSVACFAIRSRKRRETFLGFYAPLSLIVLLVMWAIGLILGFGFLQYAFGPGMNDIAGHPAGLASDLYFSGTTFTTLGLGDMHPVTATARVLSVWEAGTGFGFLAIVIGYLPVIYQAFSQREAAITLLDARAGSPPTAVELLRRYAENRDLDNMNGLLRQWEAWSAQLLESHISYPVLTLYRSQHSNESWLGALTAILDTCSLLIVEIGSIHSRQAQLTFAMARHALVDLAQVLQTPPMFSAPNRLPAEKSAELRRTLASFAMDYRDGQAAERNLAELRRLYEPYVHALANYLVIPVPSWFPPENANDNWQTSAWEHYAARIRPTELDTLDEHS